MTRLVRPLTGQMPRWRAGGAATAIAALLGVGSPAPAADHYLATDVPATLGGTDYTPNQIVRSNNVVYVVETALPAGVQLSALHRRPDGVWLFSLSHPVTLGAAEYEPRDIVSYDGVSFTMHLDGSATGIPDDARIDSLFLDGGGAPVFSFDVPVNLGGTEYSRSDLVRYSAAVFSLHWGAGVTGVPAGSNLVGAGRDSGGTLVVTFDIPTNLGGTEYLPGQLVRWNGTFFSSYSTDPAWPPYAQLRDFAFVPASGVVPDGDQVPGVPLTVNLAAGNLNLSWGGSCAASDTDYEIYEGTMGAYYSHSLMFCSTAGATTKSFPAPGGSTYYLVVPRNAVAEGSYGRDSSGAVRPAGAASCLPQQIAVTCP